MYNYSPSSLNYNSLHSPSLDQWWLEEASSANYKQPWAFKDYWLFSGSRDLMYHSIDCSRTRTEIHVLPVHDRHTRALSRNTKYWTIDSQVCFYRRLFIDAVKSRGCISWPWAGLGGIAILVLDISYRKKPPIYRDFYKNVCIDCSIREFRSLY